MTSHYSGVGSIPEGLRVAPADLTEDITLDSGKTVDTVEVLKHRGCVAVCAVGVNKCQDAAVETKEQGNLRTRTQVGNNRCSLGSFALVDDEWVIDGYLSVRVDDSGFSKGLLPSYSLRTRWQKFPWS